jgi:predicted RNA polymerase sigma factor
VLTAIAPDEPEAHGLLALMELNASRTAARTDADGRAGADAGPGSRPLGPAADPARPEGPEAGAGPGRGGGFYVLQAAIIACHAQARTAADTDWPRIAALYAELAVVAPSPVVQLNRAVAVGMAEGPAAGLAIVEALADEPALKAYHLLPSVRGDLLFKLGRFDEARAAFETAADPAGAGNRREGGADAASGRPRRGGASERPHLTARGPAPGGRSAFPTLGEDGLARNAGLHHW